ncbi:glycosyl hydrolase family 2 [Lutibacter oceani]|uniref:Glycosyl hydrolase family 2 n=1 Tax=Lutibacter oceani TaxID=1853311 RepID=A0A3D9RRE3_9FLAO|nr:sugar-binding domain-containing protein [Lutibacter oceani]REE79736.1 glycosyl hydrolase family 2 [Lutibacter oceani]
MKNIYLFMFILFIGCNTSKENYRKHINLQGQWQFALDTSNIGIHEKWFLLDLKDSINLPGTTDLSQKGFKNTDTTTMHLNRLYKYEGIAWYRKKVIIPETFKDKNIQLIIERSKSSKVWIDSILVGESQLLQSSQKFDVSTYLAPGDHYITFQINNDLKLTPYGNVHIYSDDTQTNWNGILGKLYLEVSPKTFISNLQVFPNIEQNKIDIELEIENQLNFKNLHIDLIIEKTINGKKTTLKTKKIVKPYEPKINLEYKFNEAAALWDENEQPIYRLSTVISNGTIKDSKSVNFGMRTFSVNGTQFSINGRKTFLRGKHDAAVFPLTGYPPMNVEDWIRIYKIAKNYGINHYRFHTYCPPEAAFEAADQEGIYLQVELPFWGGMESDTIAQKMKNEGIAMLKAYANHPSFVMFSPGNEIWSGHEKVEKYMLQLKAYDNRPLYTMGSNNNIGYVAPRKYSDFFVGARVPNQGNTSIAHTRLTHAFADAENGGILNTQVPSTEINFELPVSTLNMPIISHEIGQYQIFPNYNEITKYTGVLRAWNLEVFKNRLKKAGMIKMDSAFQQASGVWSALCYKAEMEAALRTKGFGGFQLLDLQDFPGQGTALVGILDAFMDSKNVVTPEIWKQSCNDLVILLEFPKYCYTNTENFQAKIVVANYSNKAITNILNWEIKKQDGTLVKQGTISDLKITNGGLSQIGELNVNLSSINNPEKLTVNVAIPNSEYANTYPIWVYPTTATIETTKDIFVAEKLNNEVINRLQNGEKVLLFPQTKDVDKISFSGHFPPEFWNYGMFKGISEWVEKPISPGTLGLLTNPKHALFKNFPTEFHTNWQWFSIVKASNSLILDNTANDYYPIVQVIDNLERNHKLGLIFEFKVSNGKLLVCMSQLKKILDKPEAAQLYQSIISYMNSNDFNPSNHLTSEKLTALFNNN